MTSWKVTSISRVLSLGVTPLFCEDDPDVRATGFWFTAKGQLYLITATHVLSQHPRSRWKAQMHLKEDAAVSMTQQIPFHFKVPGRVLCCPNADVAAVPVEGVDFESVALFSFTSQNVPQPGDQFWNQMMDVGTEVRMPGYPGGVLDPHNKAPVFRFGRLAQDPTMDWFGDQSSVVNMNVYPADSGAPIVWMGQVENRNLIKSNETDEVKVRIVVRDDVKLLGIHTGGYTTARKGDVALGVYAKAQVLSDEGITSWDRMEEEEGKVRAPTHIPKSNHAHHSSEVSPPAERGAIEPTDLEKLIVKELGDQDLNLVETLTGRTWTGHFNDGKVLIRLSNATTTFYRVDPWKFGGKAEAKLPTFVHYNEDQTLADCIFVSHCFSPNARPDGIVLSAYECFDMPHKRAVPFSPDVISWTLKE